MGNYKPHHITGPTTGLVQNRENFLLPNDAYPTLINAYVWRERIKRKKGYQILGRLQRNITNQSQSNTDGSATYTTSILSFLSGEPNSTLLPGSIVFKIDPGGANQTIYSDDGKGVITRTSGPFTISSGSINYVNSTILLNFTFLPPLGTTTSSSFSYYPNLPCMGIRGRELQDSSTEESVFFDQKYAYLFDASVDQFKEFIPGTTWNISSSGPNATYFFWSTNYWVSSLTIPGTATPFFTTENQKLFWVTNQSGELQALSDPPRLTDGITWVDWWTVPGGIFTPKPWIRLDTTNYLVNWLCMLPFRGRMLVFNTWEGPSASNSENFRQRIRWSTIGSPFIPYSNASPATGSWRDDIRGQGGFLDIPTSEDIISVGFVRDNLVVFCERSTWQLRYNGRSIAPFQIERVNSELGAESPFSSIQFDISILAIGDRGILECDSYKANRIDIKIPNFVFQFSIQNNAFYRIQGVRDFINRIAYWTIPLSSQYDANLTSGNQIFPNIRLLYNYENDSWAIFTDSLTALGIYQEQSGRTWLNTKKPWVECNFPWINRVSGSPTIVGGNQQGFILRLDQLTTNDTSLYIQNITANDPDPTVITCPNHNMNTGFVIEITGIPDGTPFASSLNNQVFGIVLGDIDGSNPQSKFQLFKYSSITKDFSDPQVDATGGSPFVGYGLIKIRDNFEITSKKFNFLDEGQNIQIGFLDILMNSTEPSDPGAISLNIFLDYDDTQSTNTYPNNEINDGLESTPDSFFNSVIPTSPSNLTNVNGSKFWQRVFCATRGNFLTLQYTLSNEQMAGNEQTKDVQIDAQILWIRQAGRMTQI